jgi:protein translocase SEC61 complex gamma subunit
LLTEKVSKMSISDRLRAIGRVLKLSRKPDSEELKLSLKICILGMAVVGVFGFVIQIIATLILGMGG